MSTLPTIIHPTLLLDVDKCKRNIGRITARFKESGVSFRPHFKTHQSREVGKWFRDYSIDKITVSSLRMALYFADDGWDDITVAFPVNLLEIVAINELAARIQLNLIVEDPGVIQQLNGMLKQCVGIFIKIDTGNHRTGLAMSDHKKIEKCVTAIEHAPNIDFKGFLAHAGHTYTADSIAMIKTIYRNSVHGLSSLCAAFRVRHPGIIVSFGDTPGASMVDDFSGIDEMRPGNFVFYDLMQVQIGSCQIDDVAVAMICPVVACHPERGECIIYGGGIHFSKEYQIRKDGKLSYGTIVKYSNGIWDAGQEAGYLSQLSQEHGVVKLSDEMVQSTKPGQLIAVLPVHSCMTAQSMGAYIVKDGRRIDHFASTRNYLQ